MEPEERVLGNEYALTKDVLNEFYSMCLTYNHAYGLMSALDKRNVESIVYPLFYHHVLPLIQKDKNIDHIQSGTLTIF